MSTKDRPIRWPQVMKSTSLTAALKAEARRLALDLVGVCPAVSPEGITRLREWLEAGYAGQMTYLPRRSQAYEHPGHVLDGARSIVMLAVNYKTRPPHEPAAGEGRVSRYAWAPADYHDVIRGRLGGLADFLRARKPDARIRGVVDTAPLLERELAQVAGLGWIGKNTMLINKRVGSWFFLAALLTDVPLDYDLPHQADHCGTCRACLDACPTDAFPQPYVLDARRCISYLTIEFRDNIAAELRDGMGHWLFGCDICQEVCPWNRRSPPTPDASFEPASGMDPIELVELFELDDESFRKRFRHTPLWRSKRRGILRNAAIVLGNHPTDRAITGLIRGLHDPEPLIRSASAWALGRYTHQSAEQALCQRLVDEPDSDVRAEIEAALAMPLGD